MTLLTDPSPRSDSADHQDSTTHGDWVDQAIAAACAKIPPAWPLDAQVAVNPYLGFSHWHFDDVAEYQQRILGRPMTLGRRWLHAQIQTGRIGDADLAEALARAQSTLTVDQLRVEAARRAPRVPGQMLFVEMLDERYRPAHSEYVVEQISHFCAGYYDLGQAIWRMPRFGDSLFEAWRAYSRIDQSPRTMDIRDLAQRLASCPASAREAITAGVAQLRIPRERLADYLYAALASIGGWASWTQLLRWRAEMAGARNDDIVELLAIRVAWEVVLMEHCDQPALVQQWRQSVRAWPERLEPEQQHGLQVDLLLQNALEIGYQRRLLAELAGTRRAPERARPSAQAVFCIDVRSEVFRRALETANPAVETLGFAGFFGVMTAFQPLGAHAARPQLPVLLRERYRVCETIQPDPAGTASTRAIRRRRVNLSLAKAWKQFKLSAASCFSFVESVGLFYVGKLIADSFNLTRAAPNPDRAGLDQHTHARLGPSLDPSSCNLAPSQQGLVDGIPLESRAEVAASILNGMGMTDSLAPLVLLVGHRSSTVNNPQRASLDCGACAGQSGEANARIAATLLNDHAVRLRLIKEHDLTIPDDTRFIAAVHDTTTDDVELFATETLDAHAGAHLNQLRADLARAGELTRLERLTLLDQHTPPTPEAARSLVDRRAKDWSQVRPEWGLANNAAFIAAPRSRTRTLDLDGRAFLHEYDWLQDPNQEVLTLIMTAPMVVANWINLQYYGSTVDHDHLGAGNKVLHNVVGGRVGLLEGNGGDLRIGLSIQSLHDGHTWMHEPLRLSVFIEAPQTAIDGVIEANNTVRTLVENAWLHLFQIAEDGTIHRRRQDAGWDPALANRTVPSRAANPRGPAAEHTPDD